MSVFLKEKKTLLVDHISKTISCDLFDLLKSSGVEDDNFDGQALELVNSNCVKEKQSLQVKAFETVSQSNQNQRIKLSIKITNTELQR